jgi:hypothetical protein
VRPTTTTLAPAWAKASQMALPIPVPPPVTIATRPWIEYLSLLMRLPPLLLR